MRALVTGCAGFIGSHLTESLLADGVDVVGIDCFNDNYGRPEKLRNLRRVTDWDHFEFAPVDLSRGDLDDLLDECDSVFHLAAEPGVRPSWGDRFDAYVRNNVTATQQLLESAVRRGTDRFVYASSSSIYGEAEQMPTDERTLPRPHSPYGVTKLAGEHLCHLYQANHGVPTVALRFFSVFGPRQRPDMAFNIFCRAAVEGQPIEVFGEGRQTRDFTYVEDVVAAIRLAVTRPGVEGGAYNIGGGSQTSLLDTIAIIEEIAGRKLEVRHTAREHGDVKDTGAEITKARAELGFEAKVGLEEGLAAEYEWMSTALRPLPA